MTSLTAQRPDTPWVKRVIALVLENPGDAVYGAIAVGALLAAETPRQETYAKTVAAVVITLVLYWLAHSYADLAGDRLRSGGRLTARALLARMLHELPILIGAALPLATLLLCWIAGTGLSAAVLAAGVDLGRDRPGDRACRPTARSPQRPAAALPGSLVGALLGSLIILLRRVLH